MPRIEVPSSIPSSVDSPQIDPSKMNIGQQAVLLDTQTVQGSAAPPSTIDDNGYEDDLTLLARYCDDPESVKSAWDKLQHLSVQAATTDSFVYCHAVIMSFIRSVLLTVIVQDDQDMLKHECFSSLCSTAASVDCSTPMPDFFDLYKPGSKNFLGNTANHWHGVARFCTLRAAALRDMETMLKDFELQLREQSCRLYDTDDDNEIRGLHHCLRSISDEDTSIFLNENFNDVLSTNGLPYVQYDDDSEPCSDDDAGTPPSHQLAQ